jgi:hypothetical protein
MSKSLFAFMKLLTGNAGGAWEISPDYQGQDEACAKIRSKMLEAGRLQVLKRGSRSVRLDSKAVDSGGLLLCRAG